MYQTSLGNKQITNNPHQNKFNSMEFDAAGGRRPVFYMLYVYFLLFLILGTFSTNNKMVFRHFQVILFLVGGPDSTIDLVCLFVL